MGYMKFLIKNIPVISRSEWMTENAFMIYLEKKYGKNSTENIPYILNIMRNRGMGELQDAIQNYRFAVFTLDF